MKISSISKNSHSGVFPGRKNLGRIVVAGMMTIVPPATLYPATYDGYPLFLAPSAAGYIQRAGDFAEGEMWEAAADQLQTLLTQGVETNSSLLPDVAYILGNAYSNTGNARCMELLDSFIERNPSSPLVPEAMMAKGDFLFFSQDYPAACAVYAEINPQSLPAGLCEDETYRYALSMIKSGLISEARLLMLSLANDPKYSTASLFYDAYIDYYEKRYDEAYEKFSRIDTPVEELSNRRIARRTNYIPTGLEAGYYLVQIDYLKGNYRRAINTGLVLEKKTPVEELLPETNRAIGLSYFKLGEYDEAYPILEEYMEERGSEAYYEAEYALAVILYSRSQIEESARLFEHLTGYEDAIGQSSLLYMGQIEAMRGDDNAAAILFEKSTRMTFDKKVGQSALYNYVVARTRGGNIPFNTSVDLLERYVRLYPNTPQTPAVEEYLAVTYYNNNDFESALQSIERINRPGKSVMQIKQKILYELGMRQLSRGDVSGAVNSLQKAVALKDINPGLMGQAQLWLADALYARGDLQGANEAYTAALRTDLGNNRGLALYGKGYALCGMNRYKQALPLFLEASSTTTLSAPLRADARLRAADCRLYEGETAAARDEYAAIARTNDVGADYAAWRYATILGLQNDRKGKITQLESLVKKSDSRWTPAILSDLAAAYMDQKDVNAALPLLRRLVSDFPSTEQGIAADQELRTIYAGRGELPEYAEFLRSVSSPFSMNRNEVEQLTFTAAADIFNSSGNIERLVKYLADFPAGLNSTEAHYMVARGYEEAGDNHRALEHYRILDKSNNAEYRNAARIGVMRNATDPRERLEYSRLVAGSGGLEPGVNQEARFIMASALKETGSGKQAAEIWEDLAGNPANLYGARSAVALAEYLSESGNNLRAEKVLDDFIDSSTPHSYWLARGYILLSDIYSSNGKKYLARQYLETLRENYPGKEPEIFDMIAKRLKKL